MSRIRLTATITRLTLVALALRIVVPAGFMPAAVSDGWFIQLCPQGLSPAAMELLHPDHGRSHADHAQHHGQRGHGGPGDGPLEDTTPDAGYCPLGSLYSAAALPSVVDVGPGAALSAERPAAEALPALACRRAGYRSRAPPHV